VTSTHPSHVSQADGDKVVVEAQDTGHEPVLLGLGFRLQSSSPNRTFEMSVASDKDKADVFMKLRDAGIAFSRGREWCPAAVFEWLHGQGLTHGPFQSIAWRGPGQWVVRQEP
jgi:hypothetical protein